MSLKYAVPTFPYHQWGSPLALADAVQAAEELGFHAVNLPEHIVMPSPRSGPAPAPTWYDTAALGGMLAARTSTIRLHLNALVVPLRAPADTARRVATLDQISSGRVTVIAGTGWLRPEFEELGITHSERGPTTDRNLAAIKAYWGHPSPAGSPEVTPMDPACHQSPHAPLWVGGAVHSIRPLRRAAAIGDGWAPAGATTPDQIARDVVRVKALLEERGRPARDFNVCAQVAVTELDDLTQRSQAHVGRTSGATRVDLDDLSPNMEHYETAGCHWASLLFGWSGPQSWLDTLEAISSALGLGKASTP